MRFLLCVMLVLSTISAHTSAPGFSDVCALYPELSEQAVREKINQATNPFLLYRALVPLYYKMLADGAVHALVPSDAARGWCAGDAHPENFGALLQKDGSVVFSINDMDDAGPCPLWADALRFFTAVKLHDGHIDLAPLLNAYRDGVEGKTEKLSASVRTLMHEAEKGGRDSQKKFVEDDSARLKRGEDIKDVPREMQEQIAQTLHNELPHMRQLLDAARVKHESGGSGGLQRYLALVQFHDDPEVGSGTLVMELKQLSQPGIFPLEHTPTPAQAERIARTLQLEQGIAFSPKYVLLNLQVAMQNVDYLARPRWQGNVGFKFGKQDEEKALEAKALKDMAHILGLLHARSANDLLAYRKALSVSKDHDWKQAAQAIATRFKEAYEALK
jgi:hypothetical protein